MISPEFRKLNEVFKKAQKKYGNEFIFGVFYYDNNSKIEVVLLPTFESVCLNEPLLIEQLSDDVVAKDIRFAYHGTRDGHSEMIQALFTENIIISPRYEHLFNNLLLSQRETIKKGIECGVPSESLRIALMKILRTAWNDTSNAVRFIKQLTDAEKVALKGVINAIGEEGCFSQAKVGSSAGVSRLTLTHLIQKMDNCGVAQVEYLGPKGTYVRVIDDTLLNIDGTNIN